MYQADVSKVFVRMNAFEDERESIFFCGFLLQPGRFVETTLPLLAASF
jgi:hypothetical protein